MWSNPLPYYPGLPTTPLPLDVPHIAAMAAIAVILVSGVFAFTLARLSLERREALIVQCPTLGATAVLVVHRSVEGEIDRVAFCSRWFNRGQNACDHACLSALA